MLQKVVLARYDLKQLFIAALVCQNYSLTEKLTKKIN